MKALSNPHRERRWLTLAVLGLAQLMVVLDIVVMNVALPSAQQALSFSDADRQWMVTAYTIAFGGLLLLGGRVVDLVGRKRAFVGGLVGFALASVVAGAAQSLEMLIAGRALQGAFGALLAPAALALVTTTFTDAGERRKAFGIFGAIGVGGGALGLLLGGVLTQFISWRWSLYINVVIALPAALGAIALLPKQARNARVALDIPGTLSAGLGLVSLVFGFARAESDGWSSASTLGFIALGLLLLAVFVLIQRRVARPLLPLRIVLDRSRGGAFLALGVTYAGLLAVFVFLTYYLQQNLGLSPAMTGLAFLPSPIASGIAATQSTTRLAARFGARRVIPAGMLVAAAGMVWLAQLDAHSSYALGVLPGMVIMALGLGAVVGLAMSTATQGVDAADAGVAGAAVNTMQQVGGSLGTALLSTLAVSATTSVLAGARRTPELVAEASAHGYTTAFWCSAALLAAGALVSGVLLNPIARKRPAEPDTGPRAEPVTAH
jgi:EmrB/QacA subfamily drug resistance transporter